MAETVTDRLPAMLRAGGAEREIATEELRDLLRRAALAYLLRQRFPPELVGNDGYESIADDVAEESLRIVLRQFGTFRGESRFTTWAYRIVVDLLGDEFRRRAWHHRPREAEIAPRATSLADGREPSAERAEIQHIVDHVIRVDLSERQRRALVGRDFEAKPLVVLAEELDTTKDNVCRLRHEARKLLKRALLAHGLSEKDVRAAFERV